MYYCKTPYSDKGFYINENRLFKESDKDVIESFEIEDHSTHLDVKEFDSLSDIFRKLSANYSDCYSVSLDLQESIILSSTGIPKNKFFSRASITSPIVVDISRHDAIINKDNVASVNFNTCTKVGSTK